MGLSIRRFLIFQFIILSAYSGFSQGLPPGWEYSPTPSTHIVSLPLTSNPSINGFPLKPGDFIGVFYVDSNGDLKCGGASEWLGDQNTGIIAFGNDGFTPEKDGFAQGETINYRFYSWSVQKSYDVSVTCDNGLPTTCSQFFSNGLSGVTSATAEGFYLLVDAVPDSICSGNQSQLFAIPSGGTGEYSFSWISQPPGFNSTQQNPFVSPSVSTSYTATVTNSGETLSTSVFVHVTDPPSASAGSDQTICDNEAAQLNGAQTNGAGFAWLTSGDGTFDNENSLSPNYFPGSSDILNGTVQLTLSVQPFSPCNIVAQSFIELQIINQPEVNAGDDQTACENEAVIVSATSLNAVQLQWSTSGDGVFDNPSLPETNYNPGFADLQSGFATLTVSAAAISPCFGMVEDAISIAFWYLPETDAGLNQIICENDFAILNGAVSNAESFNWVTLGDGTFSDISNLETTYFPGESDITNGNVEIQLIAQSIFPCTTPASDDLLITIVGLPEIFAGEDATICETNSYQISANASGFDDLFWLTSGDGTFSDPFSINTIYFPGSMDIQTAEAILKLVAEPQFPCIQNVEDSFDLSIQPEPQLSAGDDQTVCFNNSVSLLASTIHYQSILWSSNGDGSFDNTSIIDPVYYPGENDYQTGTVIISIEAEAILPCVMSQSAQVVITFQDLPTAYAGEDVTILSTELLQLSGAAENYSLIIWSTEGDGTFNFFDILNPVYTPGTGDIEITEVNLALTAFPLSPCLISQTDEVLLTIDTLTNVSELSNHFSIVLSPNPTNGIFNLTFDGSDNHTGVQIFIYNDNGEEILKRNFTDVGEFVQIDLSSQAQGIYYCMIISEREKVMKKVILIN